MADTALTPEIIASIKAQMVNWKKPNGDPVTEVAIVEQGTDQVVTTITA